MKIASIQALRAVAAWLVVLHHAHQVFFDFVAASVVGWIISARGAVGVDLFFVVSGFVMMIATGSKAPAAGTFLLRRLGRIAPAYWLATVLFACVLLAFPAALKPPFRLDPVHFMLSASFTSSLVPDHFFPVLSVGWSLNFEMLFYLLLAAAIALAARTRVKNLERWLVPGVIVVLVYLYPWRLPGVDMFKSKMLLMFAAGYLLGVAHVSFGLKPHRIGGLVLLGIGAAAILATERNDWLVRAAACTSVVWGCMCLEQEFSRVTLLTRLGDWSYSTYLIHLIVLTLAHQAHLALGAGPEMIWIAAAMLITLLLSMLSYRFVELPGQRLFDRRGSLLTRPTGS